MAESDTSPSNDFLESAAPESPLGLKNPLQPTQPLGINSQFLVPLGARPLTVLNPEFFVQRQLDEDGLMSLFGDSPFFPDDSVSTPAIPPTRSSSPASSQSQQAVGSDASTKSVLNQAQTSLQRAPEETLISDKVEPLREGVQRSPYVPTITDAVEVAVPEVQRSPLPAENAAGNAAVVSEAIVQSVQSGAENVPSEPSPTTLSVQRSPLPADNVADNAAVISEAIVQPVQSGAENVPSEPSPTTLSVQRSPASLGSSTSEVTEQVSNAPVDLPQVASPSVDSPVNLQLSRNQPSNQPSNQPETVTEFSPPAFPTQPLVTLVEISLQKQAEVSDRIDSASSLPSPLESPRSSPVVSSDLEIRTDAPQAIVGTELTVDSGLVSRSVSAESESRPSPLPAERPEIVRPLSSGVSVGDEGPSISGSSSVVASSSEPITPTVEPIASTSEVTSELISRSSEPSPLPVSEPESPQPRTSTPSTEESAIVPPVVPTPQLSVALDVINRDVSDTTAPPSIDAQVQSQLIFTPSEVTPEIGVSEQLSPRPSALSAIAEPTPELSVDSERIQLKAEVENPPISEVRSPVDGMPSAVPSTAVPIESSESSSLPAIGAEVLQPESTLLQRDLESSGTLSETASEIGAEIAIGNSPEQSMSTSLTNVLRIDAFSTDVTPAVTSQLAPPPIQQDFVTPSKASGENSDSQKTPIQRFVSKATQFLSRATAFLTDTVAQEAQEPMSQGPVIQGPVIQESMIQGPVIQEKALETPVVLNQGLNTEPDLSLPPSEGTGTVASFSTGSGVGDEGQLISGTSNAENRSETPAVIESAVTEVFSENVDVQRQAIAPIQSAAPQTSPPTSLTSDVNQPDRPVQLSREADTQPQSALSEVASDISSNISSNISEVAASSTLKSTENLADAIALQRTTESDPIALQRTAELTDPAVTSESPASDSNISDSNISDSNISDLNISDSNISDALSPVLTIAEQENVPVELASTSIQRTVLEASASSPTALPPTALPPTDSPQAFSSQAELIQTELIQTAVEPSTTAIPSLTSAPPAFAAIPSVSADLPASTLDLPVGSTENLPVTDSITADLASEAIAQPQRVDRSDRPSSTSTPIQPTVQNETTAAASQSLPEQSASFAQSEAFSNLSQSPDSSLPAETRTVEELPEEPVGEPVIQRLQQEPVELVTESEVQRSLVEPIEPRTDSEVQRSLVESIESRSESEVQRLSVAPIQASTDELGDQRLHQEPVELSKESGVQRSSVEPIESGSDELGVQRQPAEIIEPITEFQAAPDTGVNLTMDYTSEQSERSPSLSEVPVQRTPEPANIGQLHPLDSTPTPAEQRLDSESSQPSAIASEAVLPPPNAATIQPSFDDASRAQANSETSGDRPFVPPAADRSSPPESLTLDPIDTPSFAAEATLGIQRAVEVPPESQSLTVSLEHFPDTSAAGGGTVEPVVASSEISSDTAAVVQRWVQPAQDALESSVTTDIVSRSVEQPPLPNAIAPEISDISGSSGGLVSGEPIQRELISESPSSIVSRSVEQPPLPNAIAPENSENSGTSGDPVSGEAIQRKPVSESLSSPDLAASVSEPSSESSSEPSSEPSSESSSKSSSESSSEPISEIFISESGSSGGLVSGEPIQRKSVSESLSEEGLATSSSATSPEISAAARIISEGNPLEIQTSLSSSNAEINPHPSSEEVTGVVGGNDGRQPAEMTSPLSQEMLSADASAANDATLQRSPLSDPAGQYPSDEPSRQSENEAIADSISGLQSVPQPPIQRWSTGSDELSSDELSSDEVNVEGDRASISIPQLPQTLQSITVLDSLLQQPTSHRIQPSLLSQVAPDSVQKQSDTAVPTSQKTSQKTGTSSSKSSGWSSFAELVHGKTAPARRLIQRSAASQSVPTKSQNTIIQAQVNELSQPVHLKLNQNSGTSDNDAQRTDEQAQMEAIAQAIYMRLRDRLRVEQERHGRGYSGRLPW